MTGRFFEFPDFKKPDRLHRRGRGIALPIDRLVA
jgi:hypothetical protein